MKLPDDHSPWRVIAAVYAILCLISLALIPISAMGLFGVEEDPVSAVFAVILALPWSHWLGDLGGGSVMRAFMLLAGGMVLNLAIIAGLGRFLKARRGRA
jgi:hypothetical protein